MDTVGSRIKALAAAAGLPTAPSELAEALGVSYESLRKWTAGDTAPNRNRAESIAAKLKCKPEAFMHGVPLTAPVSMALTAAERAGVLAFRQGYPALPPLILHAAQELAAIADPAVRRALLASISRALSREQERQGAAPLDDAPTQDPAPSRKTPREQSRS